MKYNKFFLSFFLASSSIIGEQTQISNDFDYINCSSNYVVPGKIAIIDGVNQDIGLKILFPEADYYIKNIELNKDESYQKNNFKPKYDWSLINDKNYDYLFIVIALYDAKKGSRFFKQNILDILNDELKIINNNNFKKVLVFDNYDYDYDPNSIIVCDKIDMFFKRNFNKNKNYKNNVVPFPFIMFGQYSLIEKLDIPKKMHARDEIVNRVFFSGSLFTHVNNEINYVRDRRKIFNSIKEYIYNPGYLSYNSFNKEMSKSKFSLDLNGVGDPNKRTFEILCSGSLRIAEFNDLKWPFYEEFCEETIFKNADEFKVKIMNLRENDDLYQKCLDQQNLIFNKYFNKEWIRNYILLVASIQ